MSRTTIARGGSCSISNTESRPSLSKTHGMFRVPSLPHLPADFLGQSLMAQLEMLARFPHTVQVAEFCCNLLFLSVLSPSVTHFTCQHLNCSWIALFQRMISQAFFFKKKKKKVKKSPYPYLQAPWLAGDPGPRQWCWYPGVFLASVHYKSLYLQHQDTPNSSWVLSAQLSLL